MVKKLEFVPGDVQEIILSDDGLWTATGTRGPNLGHRWVGLNRGQVAGRKKRLKHGENVRNLWTALSEGAEVVVTKRKGLWYAKIIPYPGGPEFSDCSNDSLYGAINGATTHALNGMRNGKPERSSR